MHHFSYFNKKIVIPIQSYGYVAEGKVAMLRLQNELLQHVRMLSIAHPTHRCSGSDSL
jgi:hypothetical protein